MQEIMESLQNEYNKVFNKSLIKFSKGFFGDNTIFIHLYLAKETKECQNNIPQNDLMNILFELKMINEDIYRLEKVNYSYKTKPINDYLYCNYKQLRFRKIEGKQDKIIESFKKVVKSLYDNILEDYNNNNLLDYDYKLFESKYI